MTNPLLKLIPLGGIGDVTKNMYVYEYGDDIIVVDCGIGFPDVEMYGIDLIIPDSTYLKEHRDKIRAILFTHGHEDHIGALPYILPDLGNVNMYATRLTAALAETRLREFGIQTAIKWFDDNAVLRFGSFTVEPVHVTHSIPDAVNFLIKTPVGTIYHGSDFKFDWTPIDSKTTDVGKIALAAKQGILCLLSDCVRIEKEGYTLSERVIEQTFETAISNCPGKFIVTTQSSNISRLQQAITVALRHNRKIVLLGRSIDQAVEVAKRLKFLSIPHNAIISDRQVAKYPPKNLMLLVAGSQGQVDSALSRIANDDNKFVKIHSGDTVVFSSDPIPGNENAVYTLIDDLTRLGAKIVYTDILEDLHVSGHGGAQDLRLMAALTKPKYFVPIGGTYRHMRHYASLVTEMGNKPENVWLLENGQVLTFDHAGQARIGGRVEVKNILVDGLGVGDVGHVVLRDRQQMAADGIVIVIVPLAAATGALVGEPDVISRGFVYMREAENLIAQTKEVVKKAIHKHNHQNIDWPFIKRHLANALEEFFYRETRRRPMVLPVVVKV